METPKKIHIYHYERGVGELIAEILSRRNYVAEYIPISREVAFGSIAEEIATKNPDLVFLALNFGSAVGAGTRFQEGLEELARIKARSQVPVVMVTAGGTSYREEALRKGANEYLTFPFNVNELVSLVDKLTISQQH